MTISDAEGQRGDRLTNLELLFMHLERQVAELSQIVLDQGQQIKLLQRELRRLERAAEEPADEVPENDEFERDEPTWE